MTTEHALPERIQSQLPDGDRNAPFIRAEDGKWLVAGGHALFCFADDAIYDAGMWYQVQYASWDADTRLLTVVWIEPDHPALTLTTVEENPSRFMKILTQQVNRPIVLSKQRALDSGTVLTATVRRRADGELFSSVLVQGRLAPGDERHLGALEAQVRRELGMDVE